VVLREGNCTHLRVLSTTIHLHFMVYYIQALAENAALKAAMTKQDYRIAHLVQMLNEEEAKNRR